MRDKEGREPYFIMTEDGQGELEIYCQRVSSWEGFRGYVEKIILPGIEDFKKTFCSVVLDLTSDLDDMCARYIERKSKITHLSDLDYGKGWSEAEKEFKFIDELLAVMPVTFITHAGEKEIMWQGEKIKVLAPSLSKKALNYINCKVDTIMYIQAATINNSTPSLVIEPTMGTIAGSRFSNLIGTFPIDINDMTKTFTMMQHTFEGKEKKNDKF